MLEFLGFVALIAIIFGISFGAALAGVVKFVAIVIGAIVALAVVAKLLESKKGAQFVTVAALLAVCLGVYLIYDPGYSGRLDSCGIGYPACVLEAVDIHNDNVNKGWGFAIVGALSGLAGIVTLDDDKKFPKTHSAAGN